MRREPGERAESSRAVERPFPRVEQLLDVAPLPVGELEPGDDAPRLRRIVILDSRFEMLADGRLLAELAAQPAEKAYLCCFHMGGDGLEPPTLCV